MLFKLQMIAISRVDEYQTADAMMRLVGKFEAPGFWFVKTKNEAISTHQIEKDGHLWLGVVSVGKRGAIIFGCWVINISTSRLVGQYWERRKSTSLSGILGLGPTYLFNVVSALEGINSEGANEELLRKALELFRDGVEKELVSMEQMAKSLDSCINDTSVSTISGGLPSLGKRY